jgi:hypothetical protein
VYRNRHCAIIIRWGKKLRENYDSYTYIYISNASNKSTQLFFYSKVEASLQCITVLVLKKYYGCHPILINIVQYDYLSPYISIFHQVDSNLMLKKWIFYNKFLIYFLIQCTHGEQKQ